jgi:hypothetical protein
VEKAGGKWRLSRATTLGGGTGAGGSGSAPTAPSTSPSSSPTTGR